MPDDKRGREKPDKSKIHEPLSSYYPPPFTVDEPTLQNFKPEYSPHSPVYVKKEDAGEKI